MAWLLHPVADAFEDARGDALFEEGHAAALADLMAEVSAECGAERWRAGRGGDVLVLGGQDDDHDVGDAGEGQRDEGAVDDGDEEDAEESEAEEEVQERAAGSAMSWRAASRAAVAKVLRPCIEGRRRNVIPDYDAVRCW